MEGKVCSMKIRLGGKGIQGENCKKKSDKIGGGHVRAGIRILSGFMERERESILFSMYDARSGCIGSVQGLNKGWMKQNSQFRCSWCLNDRQSGIG